MSDARASATKRRPLLWIVDDSPTEALIAERALGRDYDFERFADGSIVVERLASGAPPDLVLLDWVMPGMAGDEVCRFLRSHPPTSELPIILITASRTDTQDIAEGLASGASDYVARPFAPAELRARVDAALRAKQLGDSARQERGRLATINQLGRALFEAGTDVARLLDALANGLTGSLCDGCSILLLPGSLTVTAVTRHRGEPSGETLAAIACLADPVIHAFASSEHARATLPPVYGGYIDRFGLRGMAILPLGSRGILRGVVTVTRDGSSAPFLPDDIATIETCIEHASLAVENAALFDAERIGRTQLDAILANLSIGVIVTDAAGTLGLVNAAARALIADGELARDLAAVYRLADWATTDRVLLGEQAWVRHLSRPERTELLMRPAGGGQIAVAVSGMPLQDGRGRAAGTVTMIQDVSAEHAANAERERTAKFQQQMLGIVGHDLRTPLGAILMGTELLKDVTESDPAATSVLRRVETSANRMSLMVDQLLDVTRARLSGGIPVHPREVALVTLVQAVIGELALARKHARFELVAVTEVVGTWDPDRLGQVISNVLGNAVQYGLEGAPIVVEVTSTLGDAVVTVRNAIRDRPIPGEMLTTLFDPYRRGLDNEHNANGLGLGLYIVHEIVRAHAGTIEVDSTEAGTTFRIVLPLVASIRA